MPASDAGGERASLLDLVAFRAMAGDCGWSVEEFAAFYAAGARRELAALSAASARGDLTEVARLAHGARGSSATACVPGMVVAFRRLEQAAAAGDGAEAARMLEAADAALERVLDLLADA